jgi:hypothetical protein
MDAMRRWRRYLPVLVLGLLSIIPLWRAFLPGQAIGAFDQISHMAPWNGPAPTKPWDVLQADSVLQFYPWRHLVFDAWSKGQLPLWNPHELAGTPLLANSQSAGFYPLHVLIGLLHVPTVPAMTFLAWFHLTWAGLGVYALSRRLGASRLGGVIGGSSFALSPFMLDWTALPSVITTVAWIPWVLFGVVAIFRREEFASLTQLSRAAVGLALAVGMMILAGHLQFVAYGLMAAVILAIGLLLVKPESGPRPTSSSSLACVLGLILGIGIAAPQLLPVLQYGKQSPRQNKPTADGYGAYVRDAIKPFELANLTVPDALGSPREVGSSIDGHTVSAYWPLWVKNGANLAESAVTIGPLVLALLFLAPWKRREVWPVAILAAIAFLFALGTPLNALLYFGVPNWSATGSPGRIVVLFVLGACVIAGLGVDRGIALGSKMKLGILLVPLLGGVVFGVLFPSLSPDPGAASVIVTALKGAATSEAIVTILITSGLAALGLSLMLFPEALKYRRAFVAFPAVLAWLAYASNLVPTGSPLPIEDAKPGGPRVAILNPGWGIPWAPEDLYPPNTASLSGIDELAGYDSLLDRQTVGLLQDIDGKNPAPGENGNMMLIKPGFDPAKLSAAGVTQIYSLRALSGLAQPTEANGYLAYDLPGPGRLTAEGGTAEITDDGYDHQTISVTSGTTRVVERDRMMPGWTDSAGHVSPAGSVWRTIDLTPGQTKIELKYDPPGLRTGLIIGLAAWILTLAMGVSGKLNFAAKIGRQ